ncbi:MFS transporter [Paenibacillus glucanolyticus]|jgi:ACDE family multidrug resistance protein|uniref:MFS transporter n=1 Tax=Paenibacillus TaxID=44249 RepID=UPI0003E1D5B3|nr:MULTISPECIES: MFS transporter [Paenibacillus]ANA83246.1 MFS transporter [Paenibacillus glucanolyticus]AVV57661.1 MFS transporter [Paenibacillus glucanolyticus]ETT34432.1 major facilitator superfamily protein [Paenibacillus sp. FSL R5-808]OMF83144.1 MFS transporter [Paenibacillus glucanolyticus]
MENKKWDLVALASIPLIMTLGNSMLIPILPQISKVLGISSFKVSMLITVYAVVAILLIPIAGYLSDRYGRKKIIIPSLIIAALGGAVSAVAAWMLSGTTAYYVILAGRFLQGIGAAGAFPIVIPLVGDMFKGEEEVSKSLGIIETSNTFGKVISPILGALLGSFIWFLPFTAIPILCLISLVLVIFLVKTPKTSSNNNKQSLREFLKTTKQVLHEKGRWLYAIFAIGGIAMFGVFGVLFYLSETLESTYKLQGVVKGLVLAIPLALLCLASYLAGKFTGKNKAAKKWTGFAGMTLLTASLIVTGFSSQIYFVVGMMTLGGIGIGMVLPCMDTLLTEGVEKEQRGTITSLYSSMRFIGVSLGPPVVSLLLGANHWVMFGTLAAVAAVGGLLTLFAVKPEAKEEDDSPGGNAYRADFKKPQEFKKKGLVHK